MIHANPFSIPMTSTPSIHARMVAPPMTRFMPGAGPPPTKIATRCNRFIAHSFSDSHSGCLTRRIIRRVRQDVTESSWLLHGTFISGNGEVVMECATCPEPYMHLVLVDTGLFSRNQEA